MGTIPPTATYKNGEYEFTPTDHGEAILVIRLWRGSKESKCDNDFYRVIEMETPVGIQATHAFLVNNESDPETPTVSPYQAVIGEQHSCTCKAGICKVWSGCKHRWCLTDIINRLQGG